LIIFIKVNIYVNTYAKVGIKLKMENGKLKMMGNLFPISIFNFQFSITLLAQFFYSTL